MSLQPFIGPRPLFQFRNIFYTDGRTPWTSDQPVTRPLPTHRTTQTQNKHTHRHACLDWGSNPWSHGSTELRQSMPQTARPLWSAEIYKREIFSEVDHKQNILLLDSNTNLTVLFCVIVSWLCFLLWLRLISAYIYNWNPFISYSLSYTTRFDSKTVIIMWSTQKVVKVPTLWGKDS
jgi:hypothetical protein